MANKALAKRQKLSFRVEPSQQGGKPRNPVAVPAKQRAAGPHTKGKSANRQAKKRELIRLLLQKNADD
ncbi:MAG: hypothetical protein NBV65_02790 [Burkholderiaceae bacterium]|nr:hypothetical protein [Burkholderiaceae bacterium]